VQMSVDHNSINNNTRFQHVNHARNKSKEKVIYQRHKKDLNNLYNNLLDKKIITSSEVIILNYV